MGSCSAYRYVRPNQFQNVDEEIYMSYIRLKLYFCFCLGFILLYVFYVLVVVVGRYIHSRRRNRTSGSGNVQDSWESKYFRSLFVEKTTKL